MPLLNVLASVLAAIGRQGTRAVAASVALSLALPFLAAYARPILTECIILLLTLAFLRVEPSALAGHVRKPGLLSLATLWCMVAVPLALAGLFVVSGLAAHQPDLTLALTLQAVAPPIMAAPAFAALMGLPSVLPLAVLIACIVVTPLTAPLIADLFIGDRLTLSPTMLAFRLFSILAGSWIAATILRRLIGAARIAARKPEIDGINVILLFIFAAAIMDGVTYGLIERPGTILALTLVSFALALGLLGLTALVFATAGRPLAFAVGLEAGHRNMGLMLAAGGAALPDTVWLYFAVAQFPIYLVPFLLRPVADRWARPPPA
jgi:BASS family bile acid:Na+ symporter